MLVVERSVIFSRMRTGCRAFQLTVLGCLFLTMAQVAVAADGSFIRNGVELHYRTAGAGTPIVFLNGGPGANVDDLIPAAEFVPASYQRLFYEQRGTGRSKLAAPSQDNLSLRIVVDDLEALRIHLKLDRLLLFGHSWGGMLAMAYAAKYPQRVDRLILVGPGGPTLEFLDWFSDNITARMRPEDIAAVDYWEAAAKRGVAPDKVMLEIVRAMMPAYFFDRAKGVTAASRLADGMMHDQVNTVLWADLRNGYDLRPQLRKLNRPVLILQGHQDPMGHKTAEEIHGLIRGSRLTYIARCGHVPWLEQPDVFRSAIADFLDGSRSR